MKLAPTVLALLALASITHAGWAAQQEPYDVQMAYRAVMYSAAAYVVDPDKCIPPTDLTISGTFASLDSAGNKLFGFAGLNHKQREVVVAFRGTDNPRQLVSEFFGTMKLQPLLDGDKRLGFDYFIQALDKLQPQALPIVTSLMSEYPSYKLLFTGHSLGGAMTSLFLTRLFSYGLILSSAKVYQYTFGQPRTGNFDFASSHDSLPITSYRLTHYRDPVVHLPFCYEPSCESGPNSRSPYHHSLEVFYNARDMPITSNYTLCTGAPQNEDFSCSNAYVDDSIDDHRIYFNIHVGAYCPRPQQHVTGAATVELPSNSELPANILPSSATDITPLDGEIATA